MKKQLNFILLNGAIGSGKSTIANLLKEKLKRTAIIEIEDVRHLISDYRYGKEDNNLAWNIIYTMCKEYFINGVSVLIKQTVCSQDMVDRFLMLAKKHRCMIGFYHLQAPKKVLLERIAKRKKSRAVSITLITKNIKKHEKMKYANATVIDTTKMKPSDAARFILRNSSKFSKRA